MLNIQINGSYTVELIGLDGQDLSPEEVQIIKNRIESGDYLVSLDARSITDMTNGLKTICSFNLSVIDSIIEVID